MQSPTTAPRSSTARALVAAASLAIASFAAPESAHAQGRGSGAYAGHSTLEPYILRPLSVDPRRAELLFGFGFGGRSWTNTFGGAFAFDGSVGIVRGLEIGGGLGARFGGGETIGAHNFARVNREWLPIDEQSVGTGWFANPYFRIRYAFLDEAPFMIGIEGFFNLPVVPFAGRPSCWAPGVGLPIHFVVARRVRFETGFFHEFVACPDGRPLEFDMLVPFRVNFGITDRVWLGVRSDLRAHNYRFDATNYYFGIGFQGGVRIVRQLDLVFDVLFPQFVHYDDAIRRNVFFDVWGSGVSVLLHVP